MVDDDDGLVAPACPECGHTMTRGNAGPTLLWCCARCGVTDLRGGPCVTEGAAFLLELTQPKR